MSKYSTLKAEIIASIKRNGAQAITGDLLQEKLLAMIDSLGEHYQFGGLALPSTEFTPGDEPVVFIAATPGTYADFGGLVVADSEVALLIWNGSAWNKQTTDIATRSEVSQLGQQVIYDEIVYKGNNYIYTSNVDISGATPIDIQNINKIIIHTCTTQAGQECIALYDSSNNKIKSIKRNDGVLLDDNTYEFVIYLSDYPTAKYLRVGYYNPWDGVAPSWDDVYVELVKYYSIDNAYNDIQKLNANALYKCVVYKENSDIYTSSVDISGATPIDIQNINKIIIHTCTTQAGQECIALYDSSNNKIKSIKRRDGVLLDDNTYEFVIYLSDYPTAKYLRVGYYNPWDGVAPSWDNVFVELIKILPITDAFSSPTPNNSIEYFSYQVDCKLGDQDDDLKSTSVQNTPEYSTDHAAIRLPKNYSPFGKPTKLIIYNHGAGGMVTDSSCEITGKLGDILTSCGYAILDVNGLPVGMSTNSNIFLSWAKGLNMGCKIALRSIEIAYNYVINKYNIDRSGVIVLGRSMGGLCAMNLANSGIIPVKGIGLDAPVLDIRNDAYESGDWATGTWGTAAAIAYLYGFDDCNFENGTYSIEGHSDQLFADKNREYLGVLYNNNINKMCGFNPIRNGKFVVDTDIFGIKTTPLKIWHGATDATNQIAISRNLIQMAKNAGSIAEMRTVPTSHHVVWEYSGTDEGQDYSVTFNGITGCSPYGVELAYYIMSIFSK